MKKYMMVALVSVLALGCAHDPMVKSPVDQIAGIGATDKPKTPLGNDKGIHEHDGFDTLGQTCTDVSRWTWNEGKKTFEYLTSDEMVERYRTAWEDTKEAAEKAYDSATSDENKAKAEELFDSAKAKVEETYNSATQQKASSAKK